MSARGQQRRKSSARSSGPCPDCPESGRKFKSSACRDSLISRPETKRILGLAFEMTCTALRIGDCDDGVKQAIADKIIDLAKGGGRNPDVLCEQALKDIRGPEV